MPDAYKVTLLIPMQDNEGQPFDLSTWSWWSDELADLVDGFTDMGLNQTEQAFLDRARKLFAANTDWFEFEGFAFGMRSPVFAKTRSHKKVVESPLYIALRDMWLQLGVQQGMVRDDSRGSEEGSR